MGSAQDHVWRRRFNKSAAAAERSDGDVLSSEKTRKESLRRLSLVGKDKLMEPFVREEEEEPRKRFKLPRKFLQDCESSVPRKLRSAVKKRSQESLSQELESKKPKHASMLGPGFPKKSGARKTKRKGKLQSRFPGPITKDEEEVVETLSALAGMFLSNGDACNHKREDEESSPANTSAATGGAEASTHFSPEVKEQELHVSNPPEPLSEESKRTPCPDSPKTHQSSELLDCKLFSQEQDVAGRFGINLQMIPSQSWTDKSIKELHASCSSGHGTSIRLDAQLPTRKIPAWLDSATISKSSTPIERSFPAEVSKITLRGCTKHVSICHLILSLKMPESERTPRLQPNWGGQHDETELCVHTVEPNLNVLKNGLNQAFGGTMVSDSQRNPFEARNSILQQNRCSQGPKSSLLENESFDFLALSTSDTSLYKKPNIPHLHAITQRQHFPTPVSFSKNCYSNSYTGQLSGVTTSPQVQAQLPSYLGYSGQSLLYRGLMVTPSEQQRLQMLWTGPIASTQFKPGETLKAVAQFPAFQNRRMDSPTMVPLATPSTEQLGRMHSLLSQQHHHHHQQQLISLRSSFPHAFGKRSDNFPHSALEQIVPRFHGSEALSLQLMSACESNL